MKLKRPLPPAAVFDINGDGFVPDQTCAAWIQDTFVSAAGKLYNSEHDHLSGALIGVLWTNISNVRQMKMVAAMAERPHFMGNSWTRGRQIEQMTKWFGAVPDFVLTFAASYARDCGNTEWCAIVEHELYHCAQALDEYGAPRFKRDGMPVFAMRGHDVEEFVGIVRRYGIGAAAGSSIDFVAAAGMRPKVAQVNISAACGTCKAKA